MSNIENHRDIVKLFAIPKLFEKIDCKQLSTYIQQIISPHQYGFMKGRSTSPNFDFAKITTEKGFQIHAIITDFQKAFDKVIHLILMYKMQRLGLNISVINWIMS